MEWLALFLQYLNTQVALAGESPVATFHVFVVNGGWMLVFLFFFYVMFALFHDRMMGVFVGKIKWTILAINIPKDNEQTPKAVENFFNHLAGAHVTQDLIEKYWFGELQPWFGFELISVEGYLQFVIYTPTKFRDLVEASLYAQYPDAEITEIEDYTKWAPSHFPDSEYDMWGTEFSLAAPEHFPILTYEEFEHKAVEEYFKDPMAALLETMSRIGKGEHFWYQIFIQPIGKSWQKTHFKIAADMTRLLIKERTTTENPFPILHKEEIKVVESVHRKATKNGFKCKIRVIYIAKKEVYNAKRVQYGIVGSMKQFSKDDSNGIKPLYSATAVTGHYLFKDMQRNLRKGHLMHAYKHRSGVRGGPKVILNVEELATIWHFPMSHAVRSPTLSTVSAKRAEAPGTLPLERDFETEIEVPVPATAAKKSRFQRVVSPRSASPTIPNSTDSASVKGAPPPNLPLG